MFFYLLVLELEYLKPVRECGLRCSCLCKKVNCAAIREGLFDVFVGEPYNLVSIHPNFTLNSVSKDDLLFPVGIDALEFAIVASSFLNQLNCGKCLLRVIFLRERHLIVFEVFLRLFLFCLRDSVRRHVKLSRYHLPLRVRRVQATKPIA